MIAWTDEAIEAANALLNKEWAAGIPDDLMRRALDAAVKAQGCPKLPDCKTYADRAYADGRAEALEEAAKVVEEEGERVNGENADRYWQSKRIMHAIRALKEAEQ